MAAAATPVAACGGALGPRLPPPHRLQAAGLRTPAASTSHAPLAVSQTIGFSVRHRPIDAVSLGDPHAPHPVLVVGCIHGNEPAGIAIARWLIRHPPTGAPPVWVIPDLNPDGVAADTRQNADGVDLNRNFPYRWARVYRPGDVQYQGPHPLSEPESQAARRLILRLRPRVTIWFHQPQGLVDLSGGSARIERRFAELMGLPVRELIRYPGSAPTWQNHRFPANTAFVVELPGGRLNGDAVRRYAHAVLTLAPIRARP